MITSKDRRLSLMRRCRRGRNREIAKQTGWASVLQHAQALTASSIEFVPQLYIPDGRELGGDVVPNYPVHRSLLHHPSLI